MRPTTSSHRRRHRPPPEGRRVDAIARLLDEGTAHDPDHVLVYVEDDGDDVLLGLKGLPLGTHPFAELAGFTAPAEWTMFGMRVRGQARHLDGDAPPEPTRTTFLVDRAGQEASIMRRAAGVQPLPGRATGTIPDLCRRVLELPTDPAPPSTALLWTVAWLDRVVDALGDPGRRRQVTSSWAQLAVLHPAVRQAPDHDLLCLDDPARLVALARAQTAAWTWARLRAEPNALVLPDGHLPAEVTTWMDDGFYFRWALGAFPDVATLVHELTGLLDQDLRAPFLEVMEGSIC